MADNPSSSRAIVAFLTDFGTRDHYVGAMKGAVLGICPDATLVDITHEVPRHDIVAGAFELSAAYRYFPSATVFVIVVDPGVGSDRRAIAAEAQGYRFVAPDNGVLTLVFREAPPARVVALSNPQYAHKTVSPTFEGRDRFAPAAGWLATGVPLESLGSPVADYRTIEFPAVTIERASVAGTVVRVDRFGNLITNLHRSEVDRLTQNGRCRIAVAGQPVPRLVTTYAETAAGELCALFGSSDHLEIAVREGSAADRLELGRGAQVIVFRV